MHYGLQESQSDSYRVVLNGLQIIDEGKIDDFLQKIG